MPRVSSSTKRQQGASQQQHHRDTRHENGLVGPGKRIVKPKGSGSSSNGNAIAKPIADDAAAPPPVPSTPPPIPVANGYSKFPPATPEMPPEPRSAEPLRRASLGTYSESSSSESFNPQLGTGVTHETHRRIDVNATKNSNVHRDPCPLDFALTVLRSCPLQDTIAILIILMQIPPIALSGIYMLFTLLTFVTTSSGLTLSDVFEWNLGAPSLATVICVDGIVLLIWLFLWGPIQHIILDLAQMVIALGLGGGSSSRDGGSMKNSLICLSMILLSHGLRHTKMKYSPIGYLLGSSRFISSDLDDPLESLDSIRGYDRVQSGWLGWIRSLLAIHILTQGLVKYIRDWYLRRERRDSLAQSAADPEAGKGYGTEGDGGLVTPDNDAAALQTSNALTTKKKRKQSAQIRSRQPLWAALASTKIVVVKEYELTHAASESAGSNATDIHNLGNAPFNTQPGQIWISYVGCDEVCFNTSHFPPHSATEPKEQSENPRIDPTKPFYVRVNNAVWQPTRMARVKNSDDSAEGFRWSGDVYGLTPMSNYECEFVSTLTHEIIFSTSVRTTQAKSTDVDGATTKTPNKRSLRPDSPITTLKTSIAAAESKLAEEKSRQKALRKEFHRKTNAMKKENEKLSTAVQSAGTGDDKLRQKIQQNLTQQKQAEQAIANLELELKEFGAVPETLRSAWKSKQAIWNKEKSKYDGAVTAFKGFKSSVDDDIKTLEEERTSLQTKRNKLSNRIAKVESEHARIADANARGLDEAERRRQARETYENDIASVERDLVDKINENEARIYKKDQGNLTLKNDLDTFHTQQQAAYAYAATLDFNNAEANPHFSPSAPPAQLPPNVSLAPAFDSTTAWNNSLYNSSLWGPSPLAPAFTPQAAPHHPPHPPRKARGRSSSMLSDVSGFTQSSATDEEADSGFGVPNKQAAAAGSVAKFRPPPGFEFSPMSPRRPAQAKAEVTCDGSGGSSSAGCSDGSVGSGSGSARDSLSPSPR